MMFRNTVMENYVSELSALLWEQPAKRPAFRETPSAEAHVAIQNMDAAATREAYERHCRPELTRLLKALHLDAVYVRAEGNYLWRAEGGTTIQTLDLVGGYGAGLFGHYHPELVAEWTSAIQRRVPFLAQGSCRPGAAALASALSEMVGAGEEFIVCFTNSGTETVEAALKHVQLERRRPAVVGLKGGFHGKTLGAIQLTPAYREPYQHWAPDVRTIDPWDPSTWPAIAAALDEVCGIFLEPMLGEGGVRALPQAFVDWLNHTVVPARVPIIADEIQTCMGRTGSFLLSSQLGLKPDYICLSKSLGGGLIKIGALLVRRSRYVGKFSIKHSSTFAEDDIGCQVALKGLELLKRDNLPRRCAELGSYLQGMLERLKARYPTVIKDVRGRGLMVGLELHDHIDSPSNILRLICAHDYLGYVAAAYLLNTHDIRVAPTLSNPNTLRVAPSAYISTRELDTFGKAIGELCRIIACADLQHLLRSRGASPHVTMQVIDRIRGRKPRREPARVARRVGFVGHLIQPAHLAQFDPALAGMSEAELQAFVDDTAEAVDPVAYEQHHIHSITGDEVHLSFIGLNLYSKQIALAWRKRKAQWMCDKIEMAVELARNSGCQVVGLGGYTSIVTRNCEALAGNGIALTSGNALTAGIGILALKQAAVQMDIPLVSSRLAVVGATGNIASIYAAMLAGEVGELVLVVRDPTAARVGAVVSDIRRAVPDTKITVVDELSALRDCALIVTASNAPQPLIQPQHLDNQRTVICDISVPSDVAAAMHVERPNTLVIQGGTVRLPHNNDFEIHGLPLARGHIFACMAETLLMGLEGSAMRGSQGALSFDDVKTALAMAAKHGFSLGGLRQFHTI